MTLTMEEFHRKDDFNRVRSFLIETYNITKTFQNWIPSMFENMWRGPCGGEYTDEEDRDVRIWTDSHLSSDSKIVAVTICKASGECSIFIRPYRRDLEERLIIQLERQLADAQKQTESVFKMSFLVDEQDTFRQDILKKLDYTYSGIEGHNRVFPPSQRIPEVVLPDEYSIRHVNIDEDFEQYRAVQCTVFPHCKNMTLHLAKVYSEAEFYNEELDLVVVAPDCTFAAFTTVRIDPISKLAEFEPVGVHPNHRRKGLAKAIISEGLRRLQKYEPQAVVILGAASTEAATRLYDSLGFSRSDSQIWEKTMHL
jgi:mycothiol synthase